jgi:peptidoglycan hydrolase CwlO-like protein
MDLLRRLGRRWFFTSMLGLGIYWLAATAVQAAPAPALSTGAKTQVNALTAQAQTVQAQIDALDTQLEQKAEEYSKCVGDLDAAHARMSSLRRMIAQAQAGKAHAQEMLAERIKSVYMSGGRDQLLQLVVLANGVQDLYNRVRLVAMLAEQDQRLVADLRTSSARLDLLLTAIDDEKSQESALKRQLSAGAAEIQAAMAQKEQTLAGLDAKVKAIVEQERQRQIAEQARLQQERQARLLAAQAAAQYYGGNRTQIAQRGANTLTPEQIAYVAQKAGFTGHDLVIAVAVALAESGGNANAEGDVAIGGSFGLWQIYCVAHPYLIPPSNPDSVPWYDPYQNAQWAYKVSGGSNWEPWSTYIHGSYRPHMAAAEAAVLLLVTDQLAASPAN